MLDREKVITEIEDALSGNLAKVGHLYRMSLNELKDKTLKDALDLLKEYEAFEPYMDFDGHDVWRCGKCGATIFHIYHNASDEDAKNYAKFCRHCGRPVKW